jgi:hypothetical protein
MARRVLIMIAVCMLVSACGSSGDPNGSADQPTPRQMKPHPGMADVGPVAWERVDVREDGRTLQVFWDSGPAPCFMLDRVELVQSPETVTVTLYEGRDPKLPAGAVCPTILVTKWTPVMLETPLGDRKVVDGTSGQHT